MRSEMLRGLGIGVAVLIGTLWAGQAQAFQTEMLVSSGSNVNRINMIIMGDGYRDVDQALLKTRALAIVATFMKHPMYSDYRDYINVKLIHSVSIDDGARNGNNPPTSKTVFDTYFNCSNIDRLLCIGNQAAVANTLAADAPEYTSGSDLVIISVNDSKYGGSGGTYTTASAASSAPEIAVHEVSHLLGNLADEYSDPYPGYPACKAECPEPNATPIVGATCKWSPWFEASTPLPTPAGNGYSAKVGEFLGARYSNSVYRPWETCEMRALGNQLCPVCGEALIWGIYSKVDVIETSLPKAASVPIGTAESRAFSFDGPRPYPTDTLEAIWTLDGIEVPGTKGKRNIVLSGAGLSVATHKLTLTVKDLSTRVRRDPNKVLSTKHDWLIDVFSGGDPDSGLPDASNFDGAAGSTGGNGGAGGSSGTDAGSAGKPGDAGKDSETGTGGSAGKADSGTGGKGDSGIDSGVAGKAGASGSGGVGGADETPSAPPPSEDGGCSCSTSASKPSGGAIFGMAALGFFLSRRRKTASPQNT